MQTIETEETLYKVLKESSSLSSTINGGIYVGERPTDSTKEDIVVIGLSLTANHPQSCVTNVNIHVPDVKVKINGIEQYVANRKRLKAIASIVYDIFDNATTKNAVYTITSEAMLQERGSVNNEHYINLRINWLICKD